MNKMTEKEYDEWCLDNDLCIPNTRCESCGKRNHYHCFSCQPKLFQPERLSETDHDGETTEMIYDSLNTTDK